MECFDPFLALDATREIDFANLAYFGTRRVLLAPGSPRRCDDVDGVLAMFRALSKKRTEVESHGLETRLALGVQARAAPLRSVPALWARFGELVEAHDASAIGILSIGSGEPRAYRLLVRQLGLASDLGLPALIQLPNRRARAVVPQVRAAAGAAGLSPERALVLVRSPYLTPAFLDLLGDLGAAVELRPDHLDAFGEPLVQRLGARGDCLTHGLVDGLGDVMTMARVALELGARGVARAVLDALTWGNAHARIDG